MYYIFDFKLLTGGYFAERMEVLENGTVFDQSVLSLLREGVPLQSRNLAITYPKTRGKVGHVLDGVFSFRTVSDTILDVLRAFCTEDDLEAIPVTIKRKTDHRYFFINVLHKLDAIDQQQSELTELIPGIGVYNSIERLVLHPDTIGDCPIFRLRNPSTWIIISAPLKEALEALKLEELIFRPVDTFKWSLSGGIEGDNWWD